MEEIELRDALRQYVQHGEPPMGVTVTQLISKGRTQRRWRLGAGTAGAATGIAVLAALTLSPPGANPALDDRSCRLPLATGWSPGPSASPSTGPSIIPTPDSSDPPASPVGTPHSQTAGPSDPPYYPTAGPSDPPYYPTATPEVSSFTHIPVPSPGWPGSPQGTFTTRQAGNPERVRDMGCYLARTFQDRLPQAKFAAASHNPPMSAYGTWHSPDGPQFFANGVIIDPRGTAQVWFIVGERQKAMQFDGFDREGWTTSTEGSHTIRYQQFPDGSLVIKVLTATTAIDIFATPGLLTVQDYIAIARAPEMDILR